MSLMPFRRDLITICYFAYKLLREEFTHNLKACGHTLRLKTTRDRNSWISVIVQWNRKTLETFYHQAIHRAIVNAFINVVWHRYYSGA